MTVTSPLPETLLPATTDAVREIVADAHRRAEPVRITGAGTWRDAGAPVHASRTLSLAALSGIIAYVPGDLTITAWAGTTMAELSQATAAHGQWLGLDPAGDRHGTIGATVATASSGPLSHAFGTPRDLVLGLEAVTGYGEVVRPGGRVVKNVAGFDLVRLYTGAWGTLGPITALTLRLRAVPVHDVTLAIPVDDPSLLASRLTALRSPTLSLLALEWLDGATARRLGAGDGDGRDVVLVRLGGNAAFVSGQRAVLAALADVQGCDPAIWGRIATLDADAALVLRISGDVGALPARIARLRTLCAETGTPLAMQARVHRGIVRLVSTDANHSLCHALRTLPNDERCIVERQPAAWWSGERDPFAGPLPSRIRAAFDPAIICNRRRADDA